MNVLSLFAGIGGLELGLERAGMTVVGQVEIDPWARQVLAKHWPDTPRHDDVRTAPEWWNLTERPPVDVVAGGFPCQDISIAGKGAGITGERSGLWKAMLDTIRAVRPQYVLIENVAALAFRGLDVVLSDLAASGFDAEWAVFRAADLGAPHGRERLYIVAHPACVNGRGGGGLGEGRDGNASLSTRGLSGLAAPELGRRADAWLEREPRVGRMAHGVPRQVDRLRGVGNAVVPQVAEHLGRLIVDDHEARNSDLDSSWKVAA